MPRGLAVRLLDETGSLSNSGLVEVRTASGYGSVCGLDDGAANAICRRMGFEGGSVARDTCSDFHGHNICGSRGMPVAMQRLSCKGNEQDLAECSWMIPEGDCLEHTRDSVIHCHTSSTTSSARDAARLVDEAGHPSQNGFGRLEVLLPDGWSPVCQAGFGIGSASVACKSLGFAAVDVNPLPPCKGTKDLCGSSLPQLQLLCDGSESDISRCPKKVGDDVFCSPHENVVLRCMGQRAKVVLHLTPSPPVLAASMLPCLFLPGRKWSRRRDFRFV